MEETELLPEQKRMKAKQEALREQTFKTKRFAHYIVGAQGAYREGQLYRKGDLIRLPLEELPSHTWQAADKDGVAVAEEAEAKKEAEAEELAELAETEPAVDHEPAKATKKGKAGKARASDTDVA